MAYYIPDNGSVALQQADTFTTFLSQRDLSLQIPVNFVTYPGVVLTAACFPRGRYDEAAFTECLSNLLAVGFRRVVADIYWDESRSVWSLCPVELGAVADFLTTSISTATTPRATDTPLGSVRLTGREVHMTGRDEPDAGETASSLLEASVRSATTTESVSTTITIGGSSTTAAAPMVATPTAVITSNAALIRAGPYLCSPGANLDLLSSIMSGFLTNTQLDTNATTAMLTLNLHAASQASDPTGSASAPADDRLPDTDHLLSNVILNNASAYLYTPADLASQRTNLNISRGWFAVPISSQPDGAFFSVETSNGRVSTPDGWPSESFVEIQQHLRLIVGFGTVDPQMSGYNFSADGSTIFSSGYIGEERSVSVDSTGHLTDGCFFDPNTTSLSAINSSWAITSLANGTMITGGSLASVLTQSRNLTACGISPILNGTLNNLTADENFSIYETFVNTTIWSWEDSQPINSSAQDAYDDYRCAALNATSGYWQAAGCGGGHYGACRFNNTPYAWNITSAHAPYANIDLGCPDTSAFDAPRTALDNTYLVHTWREFLRTQSDDDDDDDAAGPLLWLNFNDLNIAGCWVIGQNSTCPYNDTPGSDTREIVVPIVAGVIVFIIVVLTVLVKCAGNRQQAKRRRKRAADGWDYEGVPS